MGSELVLEIENAQQTTQKKKIDVKGSAITTIHDGTILRSKPDGNSPIVAQVNEGETFSVLGMEGDWCSIKLKNGQTALCCWLDCDD